MRENDLHGFLLVCFFFFLMWPIFKVFIEFVTILLLFYVLVFWSQDVWDLTPQPGIKPELPTLESKVLTVGSPGKSQLIKI